MKAMYINCKEKDWCEEIFSGRKTIETRPNRCLYPLLCERVGIIKTGCGKSELVGECVIASATTFYDEKTFNKYYAFHGVDSGSRYYRNATGYVLSEVFEYQYPIPTSSLPIRRHGYQWCEIESFSFDNLDAMRCGAAYQDSVSTAADTARFFIPLAHKRHPELVPVEYPDYQEDYADDVFDAIYADDYGIRFDENGYVLSIMGRPVDLNKI